MGIAGGGPDGAMAEKCLDYSDVGVCVQQVSGKAVVQGVKGDVLGDLFLCQGFLEDRVDRWVPAIRDRGNRGRTVG